LGKSGPKRTIFRSTGAESSPAVSAVSVKLAAPTVVACSRTPGSALCLGATPRTTGQRRAEANLAGTVITRAERLAWQQLISNALGANVCCAIIGCAR
jgi:hypothetical protein